MKTVQVKNMITWEIDKNSSSTVKSSCYNNKNIDF